MNPVSFTFVGLELRELNFFISDLIFAVAAAYCYFNLPTTKKEHSVSTNYAYFFLCIALAGFVAGLGHLLNYYFGVYLKLVGWVGSILSNYYLLMACIPLIIKKDFHHLINRLLFVKLLLVLSLLLWYKSFSVASMDTILSIGIIALPIYIFHWKKTQDARYGWLIIGILFTMLTGLVSSFNISISENWLNAKDLNHLIVAIGLLLMFKGIKQLQ